MNSTDEAKKNGILADILYVKAVQNISTIANVLTKVTIHGKSNFAGAYFKAEGETEVFDRLKTTKYNVKMFGKIPVVIVHFIFKDPPEHERIFIQILPKDNSSEYIKFNFSEDGDFDVEELMPLSYVELTHLMFDLSLAYEAKKISPPNKIAKLI